MVIPVNIRRRDSWAWRQGRTGQENRWIGLWILNTWFYLLASLKQDVIFYIVFLFNAAWNLFLGARKNERTLHTSTRQHSNRGKVNRRLEVFCSVCSVSSASLTDVYSVLVYFFLHFFCIFRMMSRAWRRKYTLDICFVHSFQRFVLRCLIRD